MVTAVPPPTLEPIKTEHHARADPPGPANAPDAADPLNRLAGMPESSRLTRIMRRAPWLGPVTAVVLAASAALLGQIGFANVTAQPEHPITFIVEDELPYGITQQTVDAAADGRALSHEPFTMLVVERELTWDEYEHGELPRGADVMLSVGYDPADPDLSLADTRRVAVAELGALDDWRPHYRVATDVRESFFNNLMQGHGPGAVVGAGMTAALDVFDGPTRSPVFWGALAALPLMIALLVTLRWLRFMTGERARRRSFARARTQLARVVLDLDLLDLHFEVADAELDRATGRRARAVADDVRKTLRSDRSAIRSESLRLAQHEQLLTRELLDPRAPVHERGMPKQPMSLEEFVEAADSLHRRADALTTAASLRVGHAAGGSALGRIALPVTLAVEEILRRGDAPRREAAQLDTHRRALLALVHEGESAFGTESGPDVILRHADLMARWRRVEDDLQRTLTKIDRILQKRASRAHAPRVSDDRVAERERDRIRAVTGGELDSLHELRASLDVARPDARTPAWHAERILLLLDALDARRDAEPGERGSKERVTVPRLPVPRLSGLALVAAPVVAALIAGWIATATMDGRNTAYGRTLVGDQPLAALQVSGDLSLLPDPAAPQRDEDEPTDAETLTLDHIRDSMELGMRYGDAALFPSRVELVVALLPLDDYVSSRASETSDSRIEIDLESLLDAYPRIKQETAAVSPKAVDAVTGDLREGHAILPVWLSDDGSYGIGLPLTGELSTGVDSKLGAYFFKAIEPLMRNVPGEDWRLPLGDAIGYELSDLGRQMEYNNQRGLDIEPSTLFWIVAVAVWTGAQALAVTGVALAQVVRHGASTRRARRQLGVLREKLNRLALDLDLTRLDAVAVLGTVDGHRGDVADIDQHLSETMLLTAWREVQELEELPRRMQRGQEWRARVARLSSVIDALTDRNADVAANALILIRSYG